MPRRRRPTPCRRLRSRQAKREGYWRTPPHLTANVRLVSRTCASCHVRDGVVTFLPRDGGRTYMTMHVVSQRTPSRGGCTTEPSSCDAIPCLAFSKTDLRNLRQITSLTKVAEASFFVAYLTVFHRISSFLGPTFNEPPLTLGAFSPPIVARRVPCAPRSIEVRVRAQGERAQGGGVKGARCERAARAAGAVGSSGPRLSGVARRFRVSTLRIAAFSGFDKILIRLYMSLMPIPPWQSCFLFFKGHRARRCM